MKILALEDGRKKRSVVIHAIMGIPEFEQLLGNIDNLCVFATKTITEKSSAIKTGARHSYAKYLLFPVALRRKFKTLDFDFENVKCGAVEYKDMAYVIYGVEKKIPMDGIEEE